MKLKICTEIAAMEGDTITQAKYIEYEKVTEEKMNLDEKFHNLIFNVTQKRQEQIEIYGRVRLLGSTDGCEAMVNNLCTFLIPDYARMRRYINYGSFQISSRIFYWNSTLEGIRGNSFEIIAQRDHVLHLQRLIMKLSSHFSDLSLRTTLSCYLLVFTNVHITAKQNFDEISNTLSELIPKLIDAIG